MNADEGWISITFVSTRKYAVSPHCLRGSDKKVIRDCCVTDGDVVQYGTDDEKLLFGSSSTPCFDENHKQCLFPFYLGNGITPQFYTHFSGRISQEGLAKNESQFLAT